MIFSRQKMWLVNQLIKTLLIRIGLVILGLVFALILIEIGLRLIPENQLYPLVFHNETGWRLYQVDENIGWVLRPKLNTTVLIEDGLTFEFTTNSQGLRDTEVNYKKETGVYRILLLGDSFTEAGQVRLADAYPTLLESCLNKRSARPIEVINAGVAGYTLSEEDLFYKTKGIQYNPDLVLVSVCASNDISELERFEGMLMVQIGGAYRFKLVNGQLTSSWVSWAYPEKSLPFLEQFLREHSLIYKIFYHPHSKIKEYLDRKFERPQPTPPSVRSLPPPPWEFFVHARDFLHNPKTPPILLELWSVFETLVNTLQRETQENKQNLAFVIIPKKQQADFFMREKTIFELSKIYKLDAIDWDLDHQPNQTIVNFLNARAIPVLDLLPEFQAYDKTRGEDLYYQQDTHFNKNGHQLTAELMCQWLMDSNQVPH